MRSFLGTAFLVLLTSAGLWASGSHSEDEAHDSGPFVGTEFDLNRFINSTFSCSNNTDCNHGTCVSGSCQCIYGYRDSTEAACDHKMAPINKTPPWALEAGLGWIFPAGWVNMGFKEAALIRLAVMGTSLGMWFGYMWHRDKYISDLRQENFKALGFVMGGTLFGLVHVGAWVGSIIYLSTFDAKNKQSLQWEAWGKNDGEADLVVLADNVQNSLRITQDQFRSDSCAIQEKCVGGSGERRLLRFDAYIYNAGKADFVTGLENIEPEWSECHQHYHGPDTVSYFVEQKLDHGNGTVTTTMTRGHKQGFCYIDSTNINSAKEGKFGCGIPPLTRQLTQGITRKWADIYSSDTDCQWIDITGIPPGNYTLMVTVNPKGIYYQDANLTNNLSILRVEIPAEDKIQERKGKGVRIAGTILRGPRS
ncbi:MAG: hypothetical protein JKY15_08385 [Deltaproteobacteria bacterium]|nr:hypothetical protein [Deltaproteobacteria bacterium]